MKTIAIKKWCDDNQWTMWWKTIDWWTRPRVLGSCDELFSLFELIATKNSTNFKLQTFTVCFRLNAQTLGSISDFYFNFKLQHLTSTLTSYYKLQTSHFNFKRQIRCQLHIITWKVSFKSQLRMSASKVNSECQLQTSKLNFNVKHFIQSSASHFNFKFQLQL